MWQVAEVVSVVPETPRVRTITFDVPGFWEINGYHNYGDPWREQRYWGD